MTRNAFFDSFKARSYLMFSYPIRVALYERKMTVKELIKMLAKYGFIYEFNLLQITLQGKATNHFTLHYFTNIYRVLNLPLPDAVYLMESYKRWEEIKQIKLDKRNEGRIKKGLLPVTSLAPLSK